MVSGDVSFPDPQQTELTTSLQTIFQIQSNKRALIVNAHFCNYGTSGIGYDFKMRPGGDSTVNKHFLRAGKTASASRLNAGAAEHWSVKLNAGGSWVFEAAAEIDDRIAATVSIQTVQES